MNTMKAIKMMGTLFAVAAGSLYGNQANAAEFATRLSGFKEVPAAIFSPGSGTLYLKLDKQAGTLEYTLSYSGLTSPATQAHIHFGKKHVAGGIMAFFCSNLGNAPAGTPACPPNDATVSGTINANGIVGPQQQNVAPGDFDALVAALFSKTSYANVHTTNFPAGEIRGEIRKDQKEGDGGHEEEHHEDHDGEHSRH